MKSTPSGLRKGAWAAEEDILLRNCIEKYGEGKWHLVPQKAGLNRCRKSCRLRWLNYLRPDIKRGDFGTDEVDLMIRLHKLLGNRWSLIAGRLPGRTANDVKNYWNSHLHKKLPAPGQNEVNADPLETTRATTVIKPRPRTFCKYDPTCFNPKNANTIRSEAAAAANNNNNKQTKSQLTPPANDGVEWWKESLVEIGAHEGAELLSSCGSEINQEAVPGPGSVKSFPATKAGDNLLEDDQNYWSDVWDLLNSDQVALM